MEVKVKQDQPPLQSVNTTSRLQNLENELLGKSSWDPTMSGAIKTIITKLVDIIQKVTNEFEIALVIECLIRLRQFQNLAQLEDLDLTKQPRSLCSNERIKNLLEKQKAACVNNQSSLIYLLTKVRWNLTLLKEEKFNDVAHEKSQFQKLPHKFTEKESLQAVPQELMCLPQLRDIFVETLIANHQIMQNEPYTLQLALKLATNSTDPFIIALSKIAINKLSKFGFKQVPEGFQTSNQQLKLMIKMLNQSNAFSEQPQNNFLDQSLIQEFIDWRKQDLKITYVKRPDSSSIQSSGFLLQQDPDFESLQSLFSLEDMLARLASLEQLKQIVGEPVTVPHPAFFYYLITRFTKQQKTEEIQACIEAFLQFADNNGDKPKNLYASNKLNNVLKIMFKISLDQGNYDYCMQIAMQTQDKGLQAQALFQQAISSSLFGERKRKLVRASELYREAGDHDQANRAMALLGKFNKMTVITNTNEQSTVSCGVQCCLLVLQGDVKGAHANVLKFIKTQKPPDLWLLALKVYIEFESELQQQREACFQSIVEESPLQEFENATMSFQNSTYDDESMFKSFSDRQDSLSNSFNGPQLYQQQSRPATARESMDQKQGFGENFMSPEQMMEKVGIDITKYFNKKGTTNFNMTQGDLLNKDNVHFGMTSRTDNFGARQVQRAITGVPKYLETAKKVIIFQGPHISVDKLQKFKQFVIELMVVANHPPSDMPALLTVISCKRQDLEDVLALPYFKAQQIVQGQNSDGNSSLQTNNGIQHQLTGQSSMIDFDLAYRVASSGLKQFYQSSDLWNVLGIIYSAKNENDKASQCFIKAQRNQRRLSRVAQIVLENL